MLIDFNASKRIGVSVLLGFVLGSRGISLKACALQPCSKQVSARGFDLRTHDFVVRGSIQFLFEKLAKQKPHIMWGSCFGDLKGNRTPIAGMKTRCPNR